MEAVQVLNGKKSQQNNLLLKTRELASKRDAVLTDYNNISVSDVDKLNKIIPDSFSSVLFINDISALAGENGLVVKEFKLNQPKTEIRDAIVNRSKDQVYKTTVISLKLQGAYSQFVKFINDLDASLRLVDVQSVSVKPIGIQGGGLSSLEYLLEMNAYSLDALDAHLVSDTSDKDVLTLVEKLKSISIDQNIFSSPLFLGLRDFTKGVFPELQGRTNPFATIGSDIFVGKTQ